MAKLSLPRKSAPASEERTGDDRGRVDPVKPTSTHVYERVLYCRPAVLDETAHEATLGSVLSVMGLLFESE